MPKILVVDDEKRIADLIEKYLSMNGFKVIKAISGEEVEKILNSDTKIDLMVLDMHMPKVGALDIVQKAKELGKDCPVLLVTGSINIEDKLGELKNSVFSEEDILYKPIDLPVLLKKVKEKLGIA